MHCFVECPFLTCDIFCSSLLKKSFGIISSSEKCEFSIDINMYANNTVPDIFSERFDKFDIYICLYESFADLLEHFIQNLKVKQNYIE